MENFEILQEYTRLSKSQEWNDFWDRYCKTTQDWSMGPACTLHNDTNENIKMYKRSILTFKKYMQK